MPEGGEADGDGDSMEDEVKKPCGSADAKREKMINPVVRDRCNSWSPIVWPERYVGKE